MLIETNKRHVPRAGGYKEKCPIWADLVPVQRLGIGHTCRKFVMCPIPNHAPALEFALKGQFFEPLPVRGQLYILLDR